MGAGAALHSAVFLRLLSRRRAARHQRGLARIRPECCGHGRSGGRAACRGGRAAGRAGHTGGPDREKAGAVHLCGGLCRGLLSGGAFQESRRVCDRCGLCRRGLQRVRECIIRRAVRAGRGEGRAIYQSVAGHAVARCGDRSVSGAVDAEKPPCKLAASVSDLRGSLHAAGAAASAHGVPETADRHAEGSEGTDELFRLARVPAAVFLDFTVRRAGKRHQLFCREPVFRAPVGGGSRGCGDLGLLDWHDRFPDAVQRRFARPEKNAHWLLFGKRGVPAGAGRVQEPDGIARVLLRGRLLLRPNLVDARCAGDRAVPRGQRRCGRRHERRLRHRRDDIPRVDGRYIRLGRHFNSVFAAHSSCYSWRDLFNREYKEAKADNFLNKTYYTRKEIFGCLYRGVG